MKTGQNRPPDLAKQAILALVAVQGNLPVDNASGTRFSHLPVMLDEAVAALQPQPGSVIVDATFGGGGYSRALLRTGIARLIGVDRDPDAVARGRALEQEARHFTMLEGRFGELEHALSAAGLLKVDGIVADLGISSFQLDDPSRGFGFGKEGPLDMRMGREGPSAADLLAELAAPELARIFRLYGDEPQAGRIARAIVARRDAEPFTRTEQLRSLVTAIKGRRDGKRDPATLVFQALRIAVNRELDELASLLAAARRLLRPAGRLVIVTFHSGEDRLVKQFVDAAGGRPAGRSRHLPPVEGAPPDFAWVRRGVVRPSADEIRRNPRARSAKMRVAVRLPADEAEEDSSAGGSGAVGTCSLRLAA
jgi:16S rRNA (cytosine1402-N4)-methyltransferase